MINDIKNRLFDLSPTVKLGLEKESKKEDFICTPLGEGGSGRVEKAFHKLTKKYFALKIIDKEKILREPKDADKKLKKLDINQIKREIDIMYKINHPHIIKLINHFEDENNLYLILELAPKGSLFEFRKKYGQIFEQGRAAQYMREVISAVKYLHSYKPPIIHRDIKLENILLDENGRCKLADFGISNYLKQNETRKTRCGTLFYLSPEIVEGNKHDTSVDIWALGELCFELLTGYCPFSGKDENEIYSNIRELKINWPEDNINPLAKNLITKILKVKPEERPSLDEILNHAWFEKYSTKLPALENDENYPPQSIEQNLINPINKDIKIQNIGISESNIKSKTCSNSSLTDSSEGTLKLKQENDNESNSELSKCEEEKKLRAGVEPINETIESQKALIASMKQSNNKYILEINNLRKELSKKSESESQQNIEYLKNEIDKYKALCQDRNKLMANVEIHSNKIIDLKSEIQKLKLEIEKMTKEKEALIEKSKQKEDTISSLQNKIKDLNKKLEETEEENRKMQLKNKELEKEKIDIKYSGKEEDESKLIEILNSSLTEFIQEFKSKIEKIAKILNDIKDTNNNPVEKESEIEKINTNLKEVIQSTQNNLEKRYNTFYSNIEKEISSKYLERFEWQNKNIDELMEFKKKSMCTEESYNILKNAYQKSEDYKKDLEKENGNLKNEIEKKKGDIKELNEKILKLEQLNARLKDFIFLEKPLNEYPNFFKD